MNLYWGAGYLGFTKASSTTKKGDSFGSAPCIDQYLINIILGVFYTRYASEIESDPVGEYTRATMVLEELGIDPEDVTVEDFRYGYLGYFRALNCYAERGLS